MLLKDILIKKNLNYVLYGTACAESALSAPLISYTRDSDSFLFILFFSLMLNSIDSCFAYLCWFSFFLSHFPA